MSLIEKLRNLVDSTEDGKDPDPEVVKKLLSEEGETELKDSQECTAAETREILELRAVLLNSKFVLSDFIINADLQKEALVNRVKESQEKVMEALEKLRVEHEIPEEGYTVQIPDSLEGKVLFVKD